MPNSPLPSLFQELITDLSSSKAFPGLSAGLIIGLMGLIIQVSFAAMIFAGPLQIHAQRAMGLTLTGAVLLLGITTLFGGFRSSINFPQDAPTAIYAGAAAGMAASMVMTDPDTVFITIVAGLMLSSLATGLVFILAAKLRFAELLRFMPYPVVAGFLAGTGWLLTHGSLEVMTGISITKDSLHFLLDKENIILWVPGTLYAFLLFFCMKRWSHFMILPGSMLVVLFLYHAFLPISGIHMDMAREKGLFFADFSTTSLWPAFSYTDIYKVDWSAIAGQMPTLAIIPFIAMIGLLLNSNGIELASRQDLDINRELVVNGSGNILAAFAGAPAGYNSISLSMLGFKTGAYTRLVGITAALLLTCALFFGGQILSVFPKGLLGGFLLLLGISFISDFIVDTRSRMPLADYSVILFVFAIIGIFGYLEGVLFGLLASLVLFVVRFSRIPALAQSQSLEKEQSTKQRSLPHRRMLIQNGHRVQIFHLTGYLFFGSVSTLTTAIMKKTENQDTRFVLISFEGVTGFDISAINSFLRLFQKIDGSGIAVLFSGVSPRFKELILHGTDNKTEKNSKFFENRNKALEWSEDRILEEIEMNANLNNLYGDSIKESLFDAVADDLLAHLARQEKVEALMEKMNPFMDHKKFEARSVIFRSGYPVKSMVFVKEGLIREYEVTAEGKHTALRALEPGTFFAEFAAYDSWISPLSYVAETDAHLSFLTSTALRRMESSDPQTALHVHRMIIDELSRQTH
ncbi:SulP family inorganic anion transporter [Desulfobotulus sp. H1]|uniref:SulP family inorganic anion transporter n=1 Tax=Desulfobotulus pelophilus TaxID=2823377 RepID=A0ABT3NA82_9BACT|nr:SulP family inorganic anion transporter [Desulfobotulus pelophilus]MCW7754376.1 SulP family inorganic anion transporter [Desulfobotulus pelophilus]